MLVVVFTMKLPYNALWYIIQYHTKELMWRTRFSSGTSWRRRREGAVSKFQKVTCSISKSATIYIILYIYIYFFYRVTYTLYITIYIILWYIYFLLACWNSINYPEVTPKRTQPFLAPHRSPSHRDSSFVEDMGIDQNLCITIIYYIYIYRVKKKTSIHQLWLRVPFGYHAFDGNSHIECRCM